MGYAFPLSRRFRLGPCGGAGLRGELGASTQRPEAPRWPSQGQCGPGRPENHEDPMKTPTPAAPRVRRGLPDAPTAPGRLGPPGKGPQQHVCASVWRTGPLCLPCAWSVRDSPNLTGGRRTTVRPPAGTCHTRMPAEGPQRRSRKPGATSPQSCRPQPGGPQLPSPGLAQVAPREPPGAGVGVGASNLSSLPGGAGTTVAWFTE